MKKVIIGVLMLVILSVIPCYSAGWEALTVDDTAGGVAITSTTYTPTRGAVSQECNCSLETAQIRFTTDGTAPTTSVGHLLEVGQKVKLEGYDEIATFRAIRTGATSGALKVTCK